MPVRASWSDEQLQWNLSLMAPVTEPTFLTPNGRSVVDFFVSRGVQIYNVACGNENGTQFRTTALNILEVSNLFSKVLSGTFVSVVTSFTISGEVFYWF